MTPARKSTRRIAAVHDLSGVGRVSLMVVIPILSTMGNNVHLGRMYRIDDKL